MKCSRIEIKGESMTYYDKVKSIADILRKETDETPIAALTLGSGLSSFADEIEDSREIDYKDIEGFPVSTVPGHKGRLVFGRVNGKPIVAMQGRFHLYEGYPVEQVTLPVRVFALLGIKNIILTNAAGGINSEYKPGDFMLIEDHIGLFCPSPLFGANDERFGPRFPSMSEAYDGELLASARRAAKKVGIEVRNGVYAYAKGPMYETPAEVRALKILGADACGMSTVPETVAAVHGGMKVLGISCITNMAAGLGNGALSHEDVIKTGENTKENFKKLIKAIIEEL